MKVALRCSVVKVNVTELLYPSTILCFQPFPLCTFSPFEWLWLFSVCAQWENEQNKALWGFEDVWSLCCAASWTYKERGGGGGCLCCQQKTLGSPNSFLADPPFRFTQAELQARRSHPQHLAPVCEAVAALPCSHNIPKSAVDSRESVAALLLKNAIHSC